MFKNLAETVENDSFLTAVTAMSKTASDFCRCIRAMKMYLWNICWNIC